MKIGGIIFKEKSWYLIPMVTVTNYLFAKKSKYLEFMHKISTSCHQVCVHQTLYIYNKQLRTEKFIGWRLYSFCEPAGVQNKLYFGLKN